LKERTSDGRHSISIAKASSAIVNMDEASDRSPGNTASREPPFIASSTSKKPLFQKGSEIATYKLLKTNSRIFTIRLFLKVWVRERSRFETSMNDSSIFH
jgi:hypothetical protein